jgi:glycosyltransferase involved in cell wall biosynthesis
MKSDYVFGLTYTNISAAQRLYFRDDIIKTRVGVDLDVFTQKSSYDLYVKPKIVCVGTLQNRKRPSLFIDLASEFPHLDFLWYGDGELRNILEERTARSGLSNCKFIESQPHELLSQRLREADVFYLPSLHEGFGKVSIEAMACGVPTIVHGDYNPEHIDSGKDGFVVRSDVEAKKRILELVGSKDLRKRIGRNGRQKAELYSWEEIAKEWMEFFVRENESCKRRKM